jgi:hypothetical protein
MSVDAACVAAACPLPLPRDDTPLENSTERLPTSSDSTVESVSTVSKFQNEINAIVQTYILPGSEKELNIPQSMRNQAINDMKFSSDPIHLTAIAEHVYQLLYGCSHRNFIRLGVSNGTFETICATTGIGIVLLISGFICIMLLAFTPYIGFHSRWCSFAAWPLWSIGLTLVLAGIRGSCFFLLLLSRRQPLPWERFEDIEIRPQEQTRLQHFISKLVLLDRKIKVKDNNLRRLQHKIIAQSSVGGLVFGTSCVLLFIFLPVWSETVMR